MDQDNIKPRTARTIPVSAAVPFFRSKNGPDPVASVKEPSNCVQSTGEAPLSIYGSVLPDAGQSSLPYSVVYPRAGLSGSANQHPVISPTQNKRGLVLEGADSRFHISPTAASFPLTIPFYGNLYPGNDPVFQTLEDLVNCLAKVVNAAESLESTVESLQAENEQLRKFHMDTLVMIGKMITNYNVLGAGTPGVNPHRLPGVAKQLEISQLPTQVVPFARINGDGVIPYHGGRGFPASMLSNGQDTALPGSVSAHPRSVTVMKNPARQVHGDRNDLNMPFKMGSQVPAHRNGVPHYEHFVAEPNPLPANAKFTMHGPLPSMASTGPRASNAHHMQPGAVCPSGGFNCQGSQVSGPNTVQVTDLRSRPAFRSGVFNHDVSPSRGLRNVSVDSLNMHSSILQHCVNPIMASKPAVFYPPNGVNTFYSGGGAGLGSVGNVDTTTDLFEFHMDAVNYEDSFDADLSTGCDMGNHGYDMDLGLPTYFGL
ncbi:uncharacterized protein LY89DRAFT_736678 [Mollisia scopiformis]|uniref:Uncharacterized protein n=1 Tax=Mollisia scopiformis TaxID=149040 RepID=A0A194X127_MOLSC|nr:uncharacterized protein LY89DRAFT_736678 [Mollisia scopiformis]KUJ13674.1 hypothetical protein LY89DRAFT_736678 [Mollisia scopiformis]